MADSIHVTAENAECIRAQQLADEMAARNAYAGELQKKADQLRASMDTNPLFNYIRDWAYSMDRTSVPEFMQAERLQLQIAMLRDPDFVWDPDEGETGNWVYRSPEHGEQAIRRNTEAVLRQGHGVQSADMDMVLLADPAVGLIRGGGGRALCEVAGTAAGRTSARTAEEAAALSRNRLILDNALEATGEWTPGSVDIRLSRESIRASAKSSGLTTGQELATTAYHEAFHRGMYPVDSAVGRLLGVEDIYSSSQMAYEAGVGRGLWYRMEEALAEFYGRMRAEFRLRLGIK
jgi:hypothetical protein